MNEGEKVEGEKKEASEEDSEDIEAILKKMENMSTYEMFKFLAEQAGDDDDDFSMFNLGGRRLSIERKRPN